MNDAKTKQQVVDKIKSSTNILVTVSNDPSVDALSASLALTLILNKLVKHTTAIFSGAIPPAITFLDPGKTFEASTDSLRDFIIAIDKEKADHLRYKVEGDVVKIFITPYKTTISNEDLEFSQGDFNVELVLALGVENQAHLDGALEAHGRILHDATVITFSAGEQSSSLGSIDWRDETASSLCEMLMSLVEPLQAETPIVDQEIATALLTGIVAQTDRFSNTRTTSKVMTMAAQLMASGADQQLIASKLQESHEIGNATPVQPGSTPVNNYTDTDSSQVTKDGLSIDHGENVAEVDTEESKAPTNQPAINLTPVPAVSPTSSTIKLTNAYAPEPDEETNDAPSSPESPLGGVQAPILPPVIAPVETSPSNSDSSGHSYLSDSPSFTAPINGTTQPDEAANVDIFASGSQMPASTTVPAVPLTNPDAIVPPTESMAVPTQDMKSRDEVSRDEALAATNANFDASKQPFNPIPGITLPLPPPVPDFGALPATTIAPAYALDPIAQPSDRLGDILAPEVATLPKPATNDPGQFKIPGTS